jgi:hypothetical protein
MENIGKGVGNLPALGEVGLNVQMVVAGEQVVKDETIDPLRICIQPHSRIKVGGTALNHHHQGRRIRLRRTSQREE